MVLLVTETNVPALWTLDRRMQALAGIGVNPERMRVIVNRWHKGDEETLKAIQNENKYSVLAHLPNDFRKASTAFNLGVPLMENHDNVLTNQYRQLASQLTGVKVQTRIQARHLEHVFLNQEVSEVNSDVPQSQTSMHASDYSASESGHSPPPDSEAGPGPPKPAQAGGCPARSRPDPGERWWRAKPLP